MVRSVELLRPIADRSQEFLLPCDIEIVRIRRLFLQVLDDMAAGKTPPGMDAASYRVRMHRWWAAKGDDVVKMMAERMRGDLPTAGE